MVIVNNRMFLEADLDREQAKLTHYVSELNVVIERIRKQKVKVKELKKRIQGKEAVK